jgi:hypothetical protein
MSTYIYSTLLQYIQYMQYGTTSVDVQTSLAVSAHFGSIKNCKFFTLHFFADKHVVNKSATMRPAVVFMLSPEH